MYELLLHAILFIVQNTVYNATRQLSSSHTVPKLYRKEDLLQYLLCNLLQPSTNRYT
jgi:hypothetical protein